MLGKAPCWLLVFLSMTVCSAQEKPPSRLVLQVDEKSSGPFLGQRFFSCLRLYSDGRVLYASRRNSPVSTVDKATGKESRSEKATSVEDRLEDVDIGELSSFLQSKAVIRISDKYPPPHRPIDYFDEVSVTIIAPNGQTKRISTREFYVASLEEKSRYPSSLIILMDKIDEIEKQAVDRGQPVDMPEDCKLKPTAK